MRVLALKVPYSVPTGNFNGLCLGRVIFVKDDVPLIISKVIGHELQHSQQYKKESFFFVKYLWELLKKGYTKNKYEIEAREVGASNYMREAHQLKEKGYLWMSM